MASSDLSLTHAEAKVLSAFNYPYPPGFLCPPGWSLSAGGVPIFPGPQAASRRATVTHHYYVELTLEQLMDRRWDPDYATTWDAFFANRHDMELARYEGDGPPPVDNNEVGRRLWWGSRTFEGVMNHILAGENPPHVFFDSASVNVRAYRGDPISSAPPPSFPFSWIPLRTPAKTLKGPPEAGEWVVTKALIERGFSLPPSDFFTEIPKAYQLQPHNISPNSILAISNHVTLCEGHLRVTPDLSLFQYYFSVKKEKVSQTSSLATCGSITFKLRPDRIYPHTDCHESVWYWSGGFFYLKDVSDPASSKVLPEFKDGPASETPTWSQCPHLSKSPQLTRAIRRICKLTEDGLSGKDLNMSWFTKRIQPLQHRDRLMCHYTGRYNLMRTSKDNLSVDALDKRIQVLIKIPRDLHQMWLDRVPLLT
ncbi:hypothetical protein QYE76_034467 [Lolium multiflorum]|uniref:Transposase (putative) gypsy type domain-containing protein n=1 Tax=Lolium multiflorum TaxID=4521 RepID=A0AAD8QZP4_LOLMU|nr:hypothetical protein QYE76_034467 [Lolium multiflorum]